jgi:hypothetical protein
MRRAVRRTGVRSGGRAAGWDSFVPVVFAVIMLFTGACAASAVPPTAASNAISAAPPTNTAAPQPTATAPATARATVSPTSAPTLTPTSSPLSTRNTTAESTPATAPAPTAVSAQQPASTPDRPFGPRTKESGCIAQNGLPDSACTPGAVFPDATAAQICRPGYSSSVRNVPSEVSRMVYAEYGIVDRTPGQFEVDQVLS